MSDKTELNLDAERASFEAAMNAARFFPAELCFARTKSPSGRDEYANSHLQSCWVGWLAARRATIQPTAAEPVAYMCPRDPDVASAFKWAVKGVDYSGLSCACGEKHGAVFVGAPADAVRGAAMPTDISKRLRECANGPMANQDHAKLMLTAADECERFYGGMVAWKETAHAKDRVNVEAYAHKIAAARDQALEEAAEACYRAVASRAKVRAIGDAAHYVACREAILALKSTPKEPAK